MMDPLSPYFIASLSILRHFLSITNACASKNINLLAIDVRIYAETASTWVRLSVTTEILSMAMAVHQIAWLRYTTDAQKATNTLHQFAPMCEIC